MALISGSTVDDDIRVGLLLLLVDRPAPKIPAAFTLSSLLKCLDSIGSGPLLKITPAINREII